MKNLSKPSVKKANQTLDNIITKKKNVDYANRINAKKVYIINRYDIYRKNINSLEKIGASSITLDEDKKAIHSSFTSSFKKNLKELELKKVYEECAGMCPFCGIDKLEEVDHYIPKEDYAEFTLYPLNLLPICNGCNKKKSDKFLDNVKERKFINFYSDMIDDLDYLSVVITFKKSNIKKTTKIKYVADFSKITDTYLRKIVKSHYDELDLLSRYEHAANEELSNLYSTFSNQEDDNEEEIKNAATRVAVGTRNKQLKNAGQNDWKYLLYKEILLMDYIDVMVKYICI